MNRFRWMVAGGSAVALVLIALLVWGFAHQSDTRGNADQVERSPVVDPSSLSIYTNGEYGFSFFYPSSARAADASSSQSWRMNATAPGTPIERIALSIGEVRVGVSTDKKAVSSCAKPGPSEIQQDRLAVGDLAWNVFGFDLLGTDNQQHVTSYRTVHGGACFAVEAFEPIGAATTTAATDAAVVIRHFSFAR